MGKPEKWCEHRFSSKLIALRSNFEDIKQEKHNILTSAYAQICCSSISWCAVCGFLDSCAFILSWRQPPRQPHSKNDSKNIRCKALKHELDMHATKPQHEGDFWAENWFHSDKFSRHVLHTAPEARMATYIIQFWLNENTCFSLTCLRYGEPGMSEPRRQVGGAPRSFWHWTRYCVLSVFVPMKFRIIDAKWNSMGPLSFPIRLHQIVSWQKGEFQSHKLRSQR